jgi:hypothetical protein
MIFLRKFCVYKTDYQILTGITVGFKTERNLKIYLLIATNDIQDKPT